MNWLHLQRCYPPISRLTITEDKLLIWLATTQVGREAKTRKVKAFDINGIPIAATVGMMTHKNSVNAVCKLWQKQVNANVR